MKYIRFSDLLEKIININSDLKDININKVYYLKLYQNNNIDMIFNWLDARLLLSKYPVEINNNIINHS